MGRPLSQKLLKKMNIKVSVKGVDKKLVKQVGFNKYETEDGLIVTLGKDASLLIFRGEKAADVIKIVRNTLYTNDGFVAEYKIKEDGGIELLDSSLILSTEVKDGVEVENNDDTSNKEPVVDKESNEPTVETAPVTNDVTDTVSSSNDDEPIVDDEPVVDEEA